MIHYQYCGHVTSPVFERCSQGSFYENVHPNDSCQGFKEVTAERYQRCPQCLANPPSSGGLRGFLDGLSRRASVPPLPSDQVSAPEVNRRASLFSNSTVSSARPSMFSTSATRADTVRAPSVATTMDDEPTPLSQRLTGLFSTFKRRDTNISSSGREIIHLNEPVFKQREISQAPKTFNNTMIPMQQESRPKTPENRNNKEESHFEKKLSKDFWSGLDNLK
ncbi:hypothetical protein GLAREA_07020 [Glarea lozoyensis ATCC 20868]|nr:uncharacterized protein GLAREA_07020 [Glarea lozoyensis ATCC 20868]EPE34007.1 hypothetical protein GLAREA_07020 [Glarea lozoyensis ATCC 20868]